MSALKLTFLNAYRDLGLLVLRIGAGGVMALIHGYAKLTGGPELWEKLGGTMGRFGIHFFPVFWGFMAMAAEFFGGLLVMIGLLHRVAALLVALTMVVASITKISNEGWSNAGYPLVMLFVFAAMVLLGPGKYSVDRS